MRFVGITTNVKRITESPDFTFYVSRFHTAEKGERVEVAGWVGKPNRLLNHLDQGYPQNQQRHLIFLRGLV